MTVFRTIAATLATVALATPAAPALSARRSPETTSSPAGTPARTASDAGAATKARAEDLRRLEAGGSSSAATAPALAQEQYYSSYGKPTPANPTAGTIVRDSSDGIAPLPFVVAMVGALMAGIAVATALHALAARRRAHLA